MRITIIILFVMSQAEEPQYCKVLAGAKTHVNILIASYTLPFPHTTDFQLCLHNLLWLYCGNRIKQSLKLQAFKAAHESLSEIKVDQFPICFIESNYNIKLFLWTV
jgi:hypothetical protein